MQCQNLRSVRWRFAGDGVMWQSPKWWWWWWCKIMATCRRLALPEMQRATMVLLQTCSPWKYEFYLFQYVYISLGVVTIQQMIFVCIISRVNLKTRPDIAISFGPETWNSPFTFPTCKEENFENIIKVLTRNNLLRGKRLQSQERLSAQTVERVPLDVAQTILDLEVGSGNLKDGDDDGD